MSDPVSTPDESTAVAAPAAPAEAAETPATPEPAKRKRRALPWVIGIVAVLVVAGLAIFGFGVRGGLTDQAKGAKVGDCVAANGKVPTQDNTDTNASAKVVSCTATDAAYTVVGRVEGVADQDSTACEKFFTDPNADYFVYASNSGKGYLLCLQTKKAA